MLLQAGAFAPFAPAGAGAKTLAKTLARSLAGAGARAVALALALALALAYFPAPPALAGSAPPAPGAGSASAPVPDATAGWDSEGIRYYWPGGSPASLDQGEWQSGAAVIALHGSVVPDGTAFAGQPDHYVEYTFSGYEAVSAELGIIPWETWPSVACVAMVYAGGHSGQPVPLAEQSIDLRAGGEAMSSAALFSAGGLDAGEMYTIRVTNTAAGSFVFSGFGLFEQDPEFGAARIAAGEGDEIAWDAPAGFAPVGYKLVWWYGDAPAGKKTINIADGSAASAQIYGLESGRGVCLALYALTSRGAHAGLFEFAAEGGNAAPPLPDTLAVPWNAGGDGSAPNPDIAWSADWLFDYEPGVAATGGGASLTYTFDGYEAVEVWLRIANSGNASANCQIAAYYGGSAGGQAVPGGRGLVDNSQRNLPEGDLLAYRLTGLDPAREYTILVQNAPVGPGHSGLRFLGLSLFKGGDAVGKEDVGLEDGPEAPPDGETYVRWDAIEPGGDPAGLAHGDYAVKYFTGVYSGTQNNADFPTFPLREGAGASLGTYDIWLKDHPAYPSGVLTGAQAPYFTYSFTGAEAIALEFPVVANPGPNGAKGGAMLLYEGKDSTADEALLKSATIKPHSAGNSKELYTLKGLDAGKWHTVKVQADQTGGVFAFTKFILYEDGSGAADDDADPAGDAEITQFWLNGVKADMGAMASVEGAPHPTKELRVALPSSHRASFVPYLEHNAPQSARVTVAQPAADEFGARIPGDLTVKSESLDKTQTFEYIFHLEKSPDAEAISQTTSWVGNSYPGLDGKWVQDFVEGMEVAADGTCYTWSRWDEGHREYGVYKDGEVVGNDPAKGAAVNSRMAVAGGRAFTLPGAAKPSGDDDPAYVTRFVLQQDKAVTMDGGEAVCAEVANATALGVSNYSGYLMVADGKAGKIYFYDVSGGAPVLKYSFGLGGISYPDWVYAGAGSSGSGFEARTRLPADAGDAAGIVKPYKLWDVKGIGQDAAGNIYIASSQDGVLLRCVRVSGDLSKQETYDDPENYELAWQLENMSFVDAWDFDRVMDGGTEAGRAAGLEPWEGGMYSIRARYAMDYRDSLYEAGYGAGEQGGPGAGSRGRLLAVTMDTARFPDDVRGNMNDGVSHATAAAFVRYVGGEKFLYVNGMFPGTLYIFRFDGEIAVPASIISSTWVRSEGNGGLAINSLPGQPARATLEAPAESGGKSFIWTDANGDGCLDVAEFALTDKLGYAFGISIAENGDIFWNCTEDPTNSANEHVAAKYRGKIVRFRFGGTDSHGNPIYGAGAGDGAGEGEGSGGVDVYDAPLADFSLIRRIEYQRADAAGAVVDTLYVMGYTDEYPDYYQGVNWGGAGRVLARYDNFTGLASPGGQRMAKVWQKAVPYYLINWYDTGNFSDIGRWITPTSIAVADDVIFMSFGSSGPLGYANAETSVYAASDGAFLGGMIPDKSVVGGLDWLDIPNASNAFRRYDGEDESGKPAYSWWLTVEEDHTGKQLLYHVYPYNGRPATGDGAETPDYPIADAGRAASPLALDGDLGKPEWQGLLTNGAENRGVTSSDNEVRFGALWDDECLYVGVDVYDPTPVVGHYGESWWENDAIEIMIDPSNKGSGAYDERARQFIFCRSSNGGGAGDDFFANTASPGVAYGRMYPEKYRNGAAYGDFRDYDGYWLEIAVPWSAMGMAAPAAGAAVGFELGCDDAQVAGGGRVTALSWAGAPAAYANVDGYGKLVLRPAGGGQDPGSGVDPDPDPDPDPGTGPEPGDGAEPAAVRALRSLAENASAICAEAFEAATWSAFEPALAAAQAALGDSGADQAAAEGARGALEAAIGGLRVAGALDAGYGELVRLLLSAALLDKNGYTAESWGSLEAVVAEAWALVAGAATGGGTSGAGGYEPSGAGGAGGEYEPNGSYSLFGYYPLADAELAALIMRIRLQDAIDRLVPAGQGGQGGPPSRARIAGGIYAEDSDIEIIEEYADPEDDVEAKFVFAGGNISKVGMIELILNYPETAAVSLALPGALEAAGATLDYGVESAPASPLPGYKALRAYLYAAPSETITLADGAPLLEIAVNYGAIRGASPPGDGAYALPGGNAFALPLALTHLSIDYYDDAWKGGLEGIDADAAISASYARAIMRAFSRFDVNRDGSVTLADVDTVRFYLGAAKSGGAWASEIIARCDLAKDAEDRIDINDLTQAMAKYESPRP
jgi:hypothetical protein